MRPDGDGRTLRLPSGLGSSGRGRLQFPVQQRGLPRPRGQVSLRDEALPLTLTLSPQGRGDKRSPLFSVDRCRMAKGWNKRLPCDCLTLHL